MEAAGGQSRLSVLAAALTLIVLVATPAQATTVKHRLANVRVPAYCNMPATRLHHNTTPKKYLPRQGQILDGEYGAKPISVRLRKHGTQLLALYDCTAGGVGWPQVLVLYDKHNKLISSLKLDHYAPGREHTQVDHWRRSGHSAILKWEAYDGAGFNIKHHRSKLVLRDGKLKFA